MVVDSSLFFPKWPLSGLGFCPCGAGDRPDLGYLLPTATTLAAVGGNPNSQLWKERAVEVQMGSISIVCVELQQFVQPIPIPFDGGEVEGLEVKEKLLILLVSLN